MLWFYVQWRSLDRGMCLMLGSLGSTLLGQAWLQSSELFGSRLYLWLLVERSILGAGLAVSAGCWLNLESCGSASKDICELLILSGVLPRILVLCFCMVHHGRCGMPNQAQEPCSGSRWLCIKADLSQRRRISGDAPEVHAVWCWRLLLGERGCCSGCPWSH